MMKVNMFTFIVLLLSCNSIKNGKKMDEDLNIRFVNISNLMSFEAFEKAKGFILKCGDRGKKLFRNYDNDNPHYEFVNFDVFLGSDIGQRNINNDPNISDFNEFTIADWHSKLSRNSNIVYYKLVIVRPGDIKNKKQWIIEGMKENEVYLVDFDDNELELMKNNLQYYLKQIEKEINTLNKK